jgi:hypothetical protein
LNNVTRDLQELAGLVQGIGHHDNATVITELGDKRALVNFTPRYTTVTTEISVYLIGSVQQLVTQVTSSHHQTNGVRHRVEPREGRAREAVQMQRAALVELAVSGLAIGIFFRGCNW